MFKSLIIYQIIVFFSLTFGFSQNIQNRFEIEKSFVLLKNNNDFLPFKNLDKSDFAVYSENKSGKIISNSISRYDKVVNYQTEKNILIISIFENDSLKNIETIFKNKVSKIVLCLFDVKITDSLVYFIENSDAVIYTDKSDSISVDYCGQLFFGAFGCNNKLNNSLSQNFQKGFGLELKGNLRFKYTIPQEVGFDSTFIFNKIDSLVNFAISIQATPGCQVFAAVNQKVIFNKSYGFFTYDSLKIVTNNSIYDLASVTKVAASAPALMLMNQNNQLVLNENFSKYWKGFKSKDKKNIKVIDILTHQARLKAWIPFWKSFLDNNKDLNSEYFDTTISKKYSQQVAKNIFENKKVKKLIYKQIDTSSLLVNKEFKYSDLTFYFYPEIVKKQTGEDFESYLNNNFYKKLGANSICFNPLRFYSQEDIVPTEFDKDFRKQLLQGYVHDEGAALMGGISGHAGLFSNANDLAKLFQMFLNYGEYGGEKYLDSFIVKNWTSYQFSETKNHRGIIFDKPLLEKKERGTASVEASDLSFGHTGFSGTFVWADPQSGLLVIFLSNRVYPSRDNKKLLQYNIRTQIHQVFYDAFRMKNNN